MSSFWLCIQDKGCGQELIIMMADVPPEPTAESFTLKTGTSGVVLFLLTLWSQN